MSSSQSPFNSLSSTLCHRLSVIDSLSSTVAGLLSAAIHRRLVHSLCDGILVQQALEMAMARRTATPCTAGLCDSTNRDEIVLFDDFTNFRLGHIEAVTQRAIMTRMSIIGANWMEQVHFKIPTDPDFVTILRLSLSTHILSSDAPLSMH